MSVCSRIFPLSVRTIIACMHACDNISSDVCIYMRWKSCCHMWPHGCAAEYRSSIYTVINFHMVFWWLITPLFNIHKTQQNFLYNIFLLLYFYKWIKIANIRTEIAININIRNLSCVYYLYVWFEILWFLFLYYSIKLFMRNMSIYAWKLEVIKLNLFYWLRKLIFKMNLIKFNYLLYLLVSSDYFDYLIMRN